MSVSLPAMITPDLPLLEPSLLLFDIPCTVCNTRAVQHVWQVATGFFRVSAGKKTSFRVDQGRRLPLVEIRLQEHVGRHRMKISEYIVPLRIPATCRNWGSEGYTKIYGVL